MANVTAKKTLKIHHIEAGEGHTVLLHCKVGFCNHKVEVSTDDLIAMMDVECTGVPATNVINAMRRHATRALRKGRSIRRLQKETIELIKEGYAAFFGMTWEMVNHPSRKKDFINKRLHVYGHLDSMGYDYAEIAAHFVNRDRSTIYANIKVFKDHLEVEKMFGIYAEELRGFMDAWLLDNSL